MTRSPKDVAEAHLAAVVAGDVEAMAADYADDAILQRLDDVYSGKDAISAYFATVPERLGSAQVVFDAVDIEGQTVTFSWHLEGATHPISGTDICQVTGGVITHQVVHLNDADF